MLYNIKKLSSSALLKLVNDGNEVATSSYSSTSASGLLPGLSLTPKELQYRDSIYIVLDQVRLIYRVFTFIKSNSFLIIDSPSIAIFNIRCT